MNDKTSPIDDWGLRTNYVIGMDPGYGSSNTSITVSRFVNGKVQIIYSKEFSRPTDFSDIVNEVWRLKTKCGNGDGLQNIILDASAKCIPHYVTSSIRTHLFHICRTNGVGLRKWDQKDN
jgi:hypothetical protein